MCATQVFTAACCGCTVGWWLSQRVAVAMASSAAAWPGETCGVAAIVGGIARDD